MSGSGLVVGRLIPVVWSHQDEARHRRLLAEAVNHTAEAAFTPQTYLDALDADLALTGAYAAAGLELTITPFIPARAHLLIFAHFSTGATYRVKQNGVVIQTFPEGASPSQLLVDLEPNTKYVFGVEVMTSGGAGNLLATSSLSVRIEHRRRIP